MSSPSRVERFVSNVRGRRNMEFRIATLPGDGSGPEVVDQAERVLNAVATRFGHAFRFCSYAIGGSAVESQGNALPDETLNGCQDCDAIMIPRSFISW